MKAELRVVDRLAAAVAHLFYRVDAVGGVPADGPVILLPNHPNALLDPALVMATAGRPIRFLAKSTLFRGPLAPILKGADAIPIYRRQDGAAVDRNEEAFADVDAALAHGEAICIFPEGISHSSGRLEPLRTGAARMALSAAARGVEVQLVPVGINLERKTTFRSRATVAYGAPFGAVSTLARADRGSQLSDTPASTSSPADVKALTAEIAMHMREVLVEADPQGDAELVDRVDRLYRSERPQPDDARAALLRRRAIASAIHRLRAERPDWYEEALIQLRRYDDRLRRFGLRDAALDWHVTPRAAWTFVAREVPAALLLVPVAAAAALTFAVPYRLTAAAAKLSDETDVTATAKVVAGAAIYGAWTAVLTAAAWWLAGPTAGVAVLASLPVLAVAGLFALERESAAWRTARSWLALRGARQTTRGALKRRRAELAGVLDQINDWISNPQQGQ
jgi:glycerol-3-phosphate O-acyltransferase / dihydroxyacetone phosphate acyltransferase